MCEEPCNLYTSSVGNKGNGPFDAALRKDSATTTGLGGIENARMCLSFVIMIQVLQNIPHRPVDVVICSQVSVFNESEPRKVKNDRKFVEGE